MTMNATDDEATPHDGDPGDHPGQLLHDLSGQLDRLHRAALPHHRPGLGTGRLHLVFGGLLLLGVRSGDLLGRWRVFIFGTGPDLRADDAGRHRRGRAAELTERHRNAQKAGLPAVPARVLTAARRTDRLPGLIGSGWGLCQYLEEQTLPDRYQSGLPEV